MISKQNFFQSIGISLGTVINSFLGLLFYLLVARVLGPADFGHFSFILGLGLLSAELGDFGLGSSLIKFGSGDDFPAVFTLAFLQRVASAAVILVIFMISLQVYAAAVGISLLFIGLISQSLLARQKYSNYILVNVLGNLLRLGLTFFLIYSGLLTVVSALVVFGLANFLSFITGLASLAMIFRKKLVDFAGAKKLLGPVTAYSRWLFASYAISSVAAKIDIPLLYFLGGAAVTGLYSSAQKLVSVFAQVAVSIEGVFAPKLAIEEKQSKFFKEYFFVVLLATAAVFITMLTSGFIIPLIFGSKYLDAAPVFNWLLVGMIFFLFSGPFTAGVLYQKGKSVFHLAGSALQLVFTVTLYFLLIPGYGIWGVAGAFILSQAFNLGYYLLIWHYVRNRP